MMSTERLREPCRTVRDCNLLALRFPGDLSHRSRNPSAPKCPRSTFMQHYQVPSAEYSSYINHVISLGLAQDYIAQLHASCSSNSPPPLRAAINQACRHLSGVVDDLQPVPVSVHEVPSLETLGQQNGAPVPDAALAWQQLCLTLLRRKLVSYGSPSLSMLVMVQLSHRTQSRLRNQLPSSGG